MPSLRLLQLLLGHERRVKAPTLRIQYPLGGWMIDRATKLPLAPNFACHVDFARKVVTLLLVSFGDSSRNACVCCTS